MSVLTAVCMSITDDVVFVVIDGEMAINLVVLVDSIVDGLLICAGHVGNGVWMTDDTLVVKIHPLYLEPLPLVIGMTPCRVDRAFRRGMNEQCWSLFAHLDH
ncbi:hypothetical protein JCM18750_35330 [Halostagnicola bangensis]